MAVHVRLHNRQQARNGTVRSEHLISNYHISIFIKSELKFCICNNDTFAQSIFGTFLIESNCVVAKFLSEFTSSSRVIFFKVINALLELKEERAKTKTLEQTVAVQTQQIAELQPKASYYDKVLECNDLVSISVIAKDYGWSANHMNQVLHEMGVQYKQSGKIWLLYQKYAEMGLTSTKTHYYDDANGHGHVVSHTYWTQKGRLFIYDLLKKDGILPIMEREF